LEFRHDDVVEESADDGGAVSHKCLVEFRCHVGSALSSEYDESTVVTSAPMGQGAQNNFFAAT
jgi:gamma-glutamyltranspeptidase